MACQTHARYGPGVRGKRGPSCAISRYPSAILGPSLEDKLFTPVPMVQSDFRFSTMPFRTTSFSAGRVVYRCFWRRSADLSGVPPGGRLRFQRSRSRSCSSSPNLVRMVRASRSPLVRSANANRKSTAANEAVSIVKRGKRGYHTNGALLGRGVSRSIGPRGVWTGLAPSGRLSTPLTHMAGFIFWARAGRSKKATARSARGSASRRDGPKSFFRCI